MSNNLQLQSVIDFVKTHVRMAPLVNAGGVANQPALDICNDVLQTLLSSPYAWRFNKYAIPSFTTIPYQQDYLLSGCQMIVTPSGGGNVCVVHLNSVASTTPGLTESGTTVTATFSDFAPVGTAGLNGPPGSTPVTTGTSVPQVGNLVTITGAAQIGYNVTLAPITALITGPNGAITGVQFTAVGGLTNDGGQGLPAINWMEHATLQDFMNTATVKPVHDIEVVASLPMESIIQPPFKIAFQIETLQPLVTGGAITLPTLRTWPIPSSQIWNVFTFYQGKAPVKKTLLDNWAPWPDELGYVIRDGVKAAALNWFEDPRYPTAEVKFQQSLLRALDTKDQELRHESYFPDLPLMRGG